MKTPFCRLLLQSTTLSELLALLTGSFRQNYVFGPLKQFEESPSASAIDNLQ